MNITRTQLGCFIIPIGTFALFLVAGCFFIRHQRYYSGLETARKWARLNEYPASAKDIRVELSGNMFTRGITVTFTAPTDDINQWLEDSPGTSELTPKVVGTVRKYEIEPGGGAMHAELEVDDASGTVTIYACWS